MENKEISLQTVLDVMNSRFEKVDKRLDKIDVRLDGIDDRLDNMDIRLDGIDNRLDNMDIRITRLDADNKEAHEKILEELQKQGNTLTRLETDYGSNSECKNNKNYFGMAHYNSASSGKVYSSVADSIEDYCK